MSTLVEKDLFKVDVDEEVTWNGTTVVVLDGCGGNLGRWCCISHGTTFDNNIGKDSHISNGEHTLGWICHEHGLETP